MKKSIMIALVLLVLAGTAFTAVRNNNRQLKTKPGFCCKKAGAEKQEKKAPSPMPYLPAVNFF